MAKTGYRHVLDGYRVLDFTQLLAGPTITRMLAEMGAEILKVELPPNGDFSRGFPALHANGRSAYYIQQNRGKKSFCIDVKKPQGQKIIRDLLPKIDVVTENYAPGVIGRMGFSYDEVRKINPQIVMCSLSAFGQSGPLSADPGYDYIAQAYAGVTSMIGDPDGPPALTILGIGDVNTGVHASGAICAALLHRERTGEGQYLDISLLDCYFHCQELNVQIYSASKGGIKPKRTGHHHAQLAPTGIFTGKDGYLVIMAFLDHQWATLCQLMGKPELAQHPRYVTNALRVEHQAEVIAVIEDWLATLPSVDAAVEALRGVRIPVAPVLSIEQAVHHPHLRQRGTVRTLTDRMFGEFEAPGFPLRFSAFAERLPLEAPFLGEHNREILEHLLGYGSGEVDTLEAAGILKYERR